MRSISALFFKEYFFIPKEIPAGLSEKFTEFIKCPEGSRLVTDGKAVSAK